MNVNTKGIIGQLEVSLDLLKKGYQVFSPISDYSAIDLIAMNKKGTCARIQVKYRHFNKENVISINTASVVNGKAIPVNFNLIDGYAIYCPELEDIVYVPKNVCENKTCLLIRRNITSRSGDRIYSKFLDPEKLFAAIV